MLQARFEPAIPGSEWPQTDILDRAATWTGGYFLRMLYQFLEPFILQSIIYSLRVPIQRVSCFGYKYRCTSAFGHLMFVLVKFRNMASRLDM
jgi:hypothetical protein